MSDRIEPPIDSPGGYCSLRGCYRPAEWFVLGTDEHIWFCRHHRDLIEDEGLELGDE